MAWIVIEGTSKYLTTAQMENNAVEFNAYFTGKYTLASICGMLGNIQRESTLNPGIKQTVSVSSGWGLIQWTPSSNLTDYANAQGKDWKDGKLQCQLINAEVLEGYGGQWIPTKSYPYSGLEFSQLKDVEEAVKAYCFERERAGVVALDERIQNGKNWYEYLSGTPLPPTPLPPTPPTLTKRHLPIYMMMRRRF
jgi:morphogenesis protein 1